MRIVSFIEKELIIEKILLHLGLWYKSIKKNHDPPKNNSIKNISESQKSYNDCDSQVTKYEDEFSQINPYDEF